MPCYASASPRRVADVTNLNAIIDETPELEGKSLYEIMISTTGTTFNNAAQVMSYGMIPTHHARRTLPTVNTHTASHCLASRVHGVVVRQRGMLYFRE